MQTRRLLRLRSTRDRKHEGKRGGAGRRDGGVSGIGGQRPSGTGEALRLPVIALLAGVLCCGMGRAAADDAASFKTLRLEGNWVRWQLPAKGHSHALTYAVATEDVEFAGARNCGKMTGLDGLLA